jgi:UDP-N-acetylglucosamine acyltransferase
MIHATAIIDSKAELGSNVEVGPYSVIRQNVSIGAGTVIGPHVIIEPYVNIGQDCHIFQYAAIGAVPQSLEINGENTDVNI